MGEYASHWTIAAEWAHMQYVARFFSLVHAHIETTELDIFNEAVAQIQTTTSAQYESVLGQKLKDENVPFEALRPFHQMYNVHDHFTEQVNAVQSIISHIELQASTASGV